MNAKNWLDGELNSNQPLPRPRASVYSTLHRPWAEDYAHRMRRKYGINLWIDGTVCTGWRIVVHKADKDRAKRMLASVVHDRAAGLTPEQAAETKG